MKPLVVVVGPTAVGKSALALHLAGELGGEIIGADSRQIYRFMDIGTAKPTVEERAQVPHHLIDIVDPDQEFAIAQFQEMAYQTIDRIHQAGGIPLLVGGTGLYIRAVTEGLKIPQVSPDPEFRAILAEKANKEGYQALFVDLQTVDPVSASRIDPRNVRRVIRALEVFKVTGIPFSSHQVKEPPPYDIFTFGLTRPRAELYERIDRRVDIMVKAGLVSEVERLVEMGYGFHLPSMSGIGYRQIGLFLEGKLNLQEAVQMVKYETHRYTRQQNNWFRLENPDIRWLSPGEEALSSALGEVTGYLSSLVV